MALRLPSPKGGDVPYQYYPNQRLATTHRCFWYNLNRQKNREVEPEPESEEKRRKRNSKRIERKREYFKMQNPWLPMALISGRNVDVVGGDASGGSDGGGGGGGDGDDDGRRGG
ncbi:hypothetical protein M0804_012255 [Polistes exclamans]|nr:hypothetical protein M0804_012255 [Polistes exclamans]